MRRDARIVAFQLIFEKLFTSSNEYDDEFISSLKKSEDMTFAKQILDALINKSYNNFPVISFTDLDIYSFVPIDKRIKTISFLEEETIENPLGVYLSKLGLTQARIAETEKYAHVTYFFDGEYDGNLENCSKILVPSLKIKTYDLDPRMSAVEVTKKTISCMEKDVDFILVNFANPDMVGHTGNYDAAIK